jgi:putative nucleotidyltransferase with HDIG domain
VLPHGDKRGVKRGSGASSSQSSLPALQGAVAIYDPGTGEHSARVAHAASAVGRRLGLPDPDIEAAWWGATLHDLGKLGIPVDVLHKDSALDEAEWDQMRRHPVIGADLLLAVSPSLSPVAEAVRAHHERWDGGGYPDGLAGEAIPILGRIIAIADAFDAMTRIRPYRVGVVSPADAISELRRQSGSQFDPHLVGLFIDLHDTGLIVAESESPT